jgi:hypothetical protein
MSGQKNRPGWPRRPRSRPRLLLGAPGLRPPCSRQRFRPRTGGRRQGDPALVLAPHRGTRARWDTWDSGRCSRGLISDFLGPGTSALETRSGRRFDTVTH